MPENEFYFSRRARAIDAFQVMTDSLLSFREYASMGGLYDNIAQRDIEPEPGEILLAMVLEGINRISLETVASRMTKVVNLLDAKEISEVEVHLIPSNTGYSVGVSIRALF